MRVPSFPPVRYAAALAALAVVGGCDSGTEPEVPEEESFPTICEPRGAIAIPDTVQATLASGACDPSGSLVDVWILDVPASGELTVDLTSDAFDPVLVLVDARGRPIVEDDDGGPGLNSRINRDFDAGRYFLYARSYNDYGAGDYRLSVHEGPPVSPCPPTATVAFPDTVTGSVTTGSCHFDEFYVDVWRLDLPADTTVTIFLESDAFEPVIVLADPSGEFIAYATQAPDRSWLELPLPAGSYDIWVGDAYQRRQTGSYTLQVVGGPQALLCDAAGTIAPGDTVQGAFAGEACLLGDWSGEAWELDLAERSEVAVSVHSDVRYPHIRILDDSGQEVGRGWGEGYTAAVDLELSAGAYRIWVLSDPGSDGAYTLTVRDGPTWSSCPAAGSIAAGETVDGKITTDDCILDYAQGDPWELEVTDSADLAMSVEGELMYPYLQVIDASGQTVAYGEGDESSASLDATLGPGTYRVWVLGPREPDFQGTYSLTIWDAGSTPTCDPAGEVAPGDTVTEALSTTDCAFPDGRYGDLWTMRLDSSLTVTVRLESDKIDPYLVLADSAGSVIAEDDDSGTGFNAALTIELAAGSYQVWATSYTAGDVGAYELSLERADTTAATDGVLAAGVAGKGGTPGTAVTPAPRRPARLEPPLRAPRPPFPHRADKVDPLGGRR